MTAVLALHQTAYNRRNGRGNPRYFCPACDKWVRQSGQFYFCHTCKIWWKLEE